MHLPREQTLALAARRGWREENQSLVRELTFKDFEEALGFVSRCGWAAEDYKKHPNICIQNHRVQLTISNPHNAGVTLAELRLAAKINAMLDEHYPGC